MTQVAGDLIVNQNVMFADMFALTCLPFDFLESHACLWLLLQISISQITDLHFVSQIAVSDINSLKLISNENQN